MSSLSKTTHVTGAGQSVCGFQVCYLRFVIDEVKLALKMEP